MSDVRQKGQIIIILLMIMLVGLSIGLALTQRSVTDLGVSSQTEQSSRAFSAAEAGLQKALSSPLASPTTFPLNNASTAQVHSSIPLPFDNKGIEYPPIGREITAQFWFVDPTLTSFPPTPSYNSSQLQLYYGNSGTTDLPAVEVRIIMYANGNFHNKTYYYDSTSRGNNFKVTSGCGTQTLAAGILGNNRTFFCQQTIPGGPPYENDIPNLGGSGNCVSPNCTLVLARVRFLYINENHGLALAPVGAGAIFPPQVTVYNSTGISGQSQKQIQAFKVKDIVPPWFDYALFSVNEIRK